jgi:hypothetical protein
MATKRQWAEIDDISSGSGSEKAAKPEDLIDVYQFPRGKWVTMRLFPGMVTTAGYWVVTKKRDGSKGRFFVACPSYDHKTHNRDHDKLDPWGDALEYVNQFAEKGERIISFNRVGWVNAIIRSEQEREPAKKPRHTTYEENEGVKEKDSDSWTPVYGVRLTKTLIDKIQSYKYANTVRDKKTGEMRTYPISSIEYGCDIMIKYDPDMAAALQYDCQKLERSPITEEEQALLVQDLDLLIPAEESEESLFKNFESWARRCGIDLTGAEIRGLKKGSLTRKPATTASAASKTLDLDEDDGDDGLGGSALSALDTEDDELEVAVVQKSSGRKQAVVEEIDDEDDIIDTPPPKATKQPQTRKPIVEEESLDDDLDEAPPKASAGKLNQPVEVASDEEDDLDDDDLDDSPVQPQRRAAKRGFKW